MILGFIAEKNLHFTDVPDLVELIKTLAKDGEALFQMFNRGYVQIKNIQLDFLMILSPAMMNLY